METWSTKDYFLEIIDDTDSNSVYIRIFKKYYDGHFQSSRLLKTLNIKGNTVGISLLLRSYEDYEIEKLLNNTKYRD